MSNVGKPNVNLAKSGTLVPSEEEKRRQRARSVAIALVLGALVLLFYLLTLVKFGPGVIKPPNAP
jgi:hypothetical protein